MSGNKIGTSADWVQRQQEGQKPTEDGPTSFCNTTVGLLLSDGVQSPITSPAATVGRYTSQGLTKLRRLYSASPGINDSPNKLKSGQSTQGMSRKNGEHRSDTSRLSRGQMSPGQMSPSVVDKATQLSRRSTAIIPSMVDKGVNVTSGKTKERTPHPSAVYIGKHPTKSWPLHPGWLVISPEVFNKGNWPVSKEKLPTIKTTFTRGKRIYKRLHQNGLINSETAVDFYNCKGWPRRRPVFITARMLVEDSSAPASSHAGLNDAAKDSSMHVSCADSLWNFIKLLSGATKKVLDSCYGGVVQMLRQCLATANSVAVSSSSSDERRDAMGYDSTTEEESDWNFTCLRQPIGIQQMPPRYFVEKGREVEPPPPPRWTTPCTPTVVTDPNRGGTPITCGTIKELANRYGLKVTHVDGCWKDDARQSRGPVTADSSDATAAECQFSCGPPQRSKTFDAPQRSGSPATRMKCVPTPAGCVSMRQPDRSGESIGSFVISLSGKSRAGSRSPERRRKCQPKTKCIPTARGCLTPSNINKVFDLKSDDSYPFDTVVDSTSGSIISDKRRIAEIIFDSRRRCNVTTRGCIPRQSSSRIQQPSLITDPSTLNTDSSGVRPTRPSALRNEFVGIGSSELRSMDSRPLSLDGEFAIDDQLTNVPQEPRCFRQTYPPCAPGVTYPYSPPQQGIIPESMRTYVPPSGSNPPGPSHPSKATTPSTSLKESVPPRGTIPPADGIPLRGTLYPRENVPVRDSMPPRQTIPPAEGMPYRQTIPPAEGTHPRESIPNSSPRVTFSPHPPRETIIPQESIPPPRESIPPPRESIPPPRESIPPPRESTPYARESVPPPMESVPLPRESIPYARESVPPTRESIPYARESVPPPRESVPPPRESIPYARESVPPPRGSVPPPRESIPYARESVPPTRDSVPPPRESVPPPRESIPYARESVPPPTESVPPPRESIPYARENVPPTRESVPPPRESVPPPRESIPYTGESVPPPRESVPPPRESIPYARESVPPPRESIPYARESVPPTTESVPPPRESVPHPRESIPYARESVPPPRESIPYARESVPPTRESVPPTRESIPYARESVPPTRESVPPTRESVPPTRESVPPTRESIPSARESVPPPRESEPPTRESVPPTRESIPSARESVPPPRESVPPTRESIPASSESVAPPRESTTPNETTPTPDQHIVPRRSGRDRPSRSPSDSVPRMVDDIYGNTEPRGDQSGERSMPSDRPRSSVPPTRESIPSARESVPPPRESVPPTRESIPSARESVPPPRESVPPTRESVPPTREGIPSARESVPPPRESVPPPRNSTAPVRESIPASRGSVAPPRESTTPNETTPTPDQHNVPRRSGRDRPSRSPFDSVPRMIDEIYGNTEPRGGQSGERSMPSDRPRSSRVSTGFGNREATPDPYPPSRGSRTNEEFGSRGGYSGSESRPRQSRAPRVSTKFGVREGHTSGGETTNPDEGRGSRFGVFPSDHPSPGKESDNSPHVMYVRICLDKDKRPRSPRPQSLCNASRAATEVNDSHFNPTENVIRDIEMRENCGVVFRDSCDKAVNVNWTSNNLKNYCNIGGSRYSNDTRFRDGYVDSREQYGGNANGSRQMATENDYNESSRRMNQATTSSRNSDTPWESCNSILNTNCPPITPIIRLTEIPRRGDCCQASIRTPNGRWHKVNIMRPFEDSASERNMNLRGDKPHVRECKERW